MSPVLLAALMVPTVQLGDSVLALAGQRLALTCARVHAAPLAATLVEAGGRPLWWPLVSAAPLREEQLSTLDELIMRLPEYSTVAFLCDHAVDGFIERGVRLSDGDPEIFTEMVRGSGAKIAAYGAAASRLYEAGIPPDVIPLQPNPESLAAALTHLDLVTGKNVAVVGVTRVGAEGMCEWPESCLSRLLQLAGSDVTDAAACEIQAGCGLSFGTGKGSFELEWLMAGQVDVVCVGSAEEAFALASMLPAGGQELSALDGVDAIKTRRGLPGKARLIAAGEAAACGCESAGLSVSATTKAEVSNPTALAAALVAELGERKLIW